MSIDKLQGLRTKIATVDEWLSGDIREDVIGAIEQGASKLNDYLIVAISSEGTVRNSSGDTMKMELLDILKGNYLNPHVSIWYYRLNKVEDVANPNLWIMANPNLGKTVSYETKDTLERMVTVIFFLIDILTVYQWKVIHISLSMRKPYHIRNEITGTCRVLWVQIFLKEMISVHLHFCFHCLVKHLVLRPDVILPH